MIGRPTPLGRINSGRLAGRRVSRAFGFRPAAVVYAPRRVPDVTYGLGWIIESDLGASCLSVLTMELSTKFRPQRRLASVNHMPVRFALAGVCRFELLGRINAKTM